MSKEDTSPGLLSKMVRFVRNPTVHWTDLDSVEADRESQYSKQMLKEMIERKRRNDFVRRREFDQLRKLRQREALQGQRTEDPTARPSFFQSSMASPDERAVTLKKIDEIEAQMSQQWWKSKQQAGDGRAAAAASAPAAADGDAPLPPMSDTAYARAFAPTAPLSLPPSVEPLFSQHSGGAPTEAGALDAGALFSRGPAPADTQAGGLCAQGQAPAPLARFEHDPDLEEAAIRFANGDYAGAEASLREVLAQREGEGADGQAEIWMTLFDLYRAIGAQEPFDALSIDFAARFGRSAPHWFSMPEQLGLPDPSQAAAPAPIGPQSDFSWNAPSELTLQSVAALNAATARAASPWTLTWSRLSAIDAPAVTALADLFTRWADQDVQLGFFGAEALHAVLQARTQSGDRDSSPEWWRLRMALLRLAGQLDEFELVALDYCVTYEVSPPSWVSPRCGYLADDATGGGLAASMDAVDGDGHASGFGSSQLAAAGDETAAHLSGTIEGDATPLLEPLEALVPANGPLVVACDGLVRIDFAAAGSVLNWVADQQDRGRVVQFTHVQRLVAVFFNVIGIGEHACVSARRN